MFSVFNRQCRSIQCREGKNRLNDVYISFSGLGVACWPLIPKFAGSNPAEAVRFLRAKKIFSTPFSEVK